MPVAVRISLLHRMMIVRELTRECRAAVGFRDRRLPSIVGHDNEAVVVGIAAALGPLDTLTASAEPSVAWWLPEPRKQARSATLTIWLNDRASRNTAQRLPALFSLTHDSAAPGAEDVAGAGVDGGDVEAVLVATRHAAHLARGHVPQLLQLVNGGPADPRDPIATLSCRLLRDRQLDDNALGAIGRDARRVAAALSATGLRPADGLGGTPASRGLRAGPQFLQDFAAYVVQLLPESPFAPGFADPVQR
jgi:hypothetical protein